MELMNISKSSMNVIYIANDCISQLPLHDERPQNSVDGMVSVQSHSHSSAGSSDGSASTCRLCGATLPHMPLIHSWDQQVSGAGLSHGKGRSARVEPTPIRTFQAFARFMSINIPLSKQVIWPSPTLMGRKYILPTVSGWGEQLSA